MLCSQPTNYYTQINTKRKSRCGKSCFSWCGQANHFRRLRPKVVLNPTQSLHKITQEKEGETIMSNILVKNIMGTGGPPTCSTQGAAGEEV